MKMFEISVLYHIIIYECVQNFYKINYLKQLDKNLPNYIHFTKSPKRKDKKNL